MKVYKGFTLTEILITLGIIGIISAISIPALLQKNYEKRTIVKLRQTQSILTQAIKMAEEEYGEIEGWDLKWHNKDSIINVASKLKHFLKIAVDCGTNDEKKLCIPAKEYKHLSGSIDDPSKFYRTSSYYYKMKLLNGTSLWFYIPEPQFGTLLWFYVDTNGKSLPNTIGKDLFLFSYYNNALYPEGSPLTPYSNRCNKESAWGCAYYALLNNNMNYLRTIK